MNATGLTCPPQRPLSVFAAEVSSPAKYLQVIVSEPKRQGNAFVRAKRRKRVRLFAAVMVGYGTHGPSISIMRSFRSLGILTTAGPAGRNRRS